MPSRAFPGLAHTTFDPTTATPVLAATLQPKSPDDRSVPWITCIVYDAESDRLFLADNFNYKVKVVHMKDPERVHSQLKFDHRPRRLALMSGRRLAVTLDNCAQVAVLDLQPDLQEPKVVQMVRTEKFYRGVVALDRDTLCLTQFDEHALDGGGAAVDCVAVQDGKVRRSVASAASLPGLAAPDYLALTPEGALYVSDWSSKRIYRLETSTAASVTASPSPSAPEGASAGDGVKVLQHDDLDCPCQLCLDDCGNLLVASQRGAAGVMVLSHAGQWRRLLATGGDSYTSAIGLALTPTALVVSWDPDATSHATGHSVVKIYDMVQR